MSVHSSLQPESLPRSVSSGFLRYYPNLGHTPIDMVGKSFKHKSLPLEFNCYITLTMCFPRWTIVVEFVKILSNCKSVLLASRLHCFYSNYICTGFVLHSSPVNLIVYHALIGQLPKRAKIKSAVPGARGIRLPVL